MGGKQGGIFEEWLKNMVSLIFMQSFHAVFLAFIIELIGSLQAYSTNSDTIVEDTKTLLENFGANDTKIALISLVAMFALIKMEKMIKDLFGLKDSKYGKGLQESFSGGISKVAGAMDMAKRSGKAMQDKKEAGKKLRVANHNYLNSKKEYDRLSNSNAAAEGLTDKQFEAKKKAAKKDLDSKNQAKIEAQANFDFAKKQAKTAVATDAASMTFALGDTRLAGLVDRGLDSFMTSRNKDSVYGEHARVQDEYIQNTVREEAKQRVKQKHPHLQESDPLFEREFDAVMNDENFKNEMNKKLKANIEAKFNLELEIPEDKLKGLANSVKQSWTEGIREANSGSEGRAYSRSVRRNGIKYKGTNIDDVDDI